METCFNLFLCSSLEVSLFSSLLRLQLHGAIYRPDSFVMMLRYCAILKAIRHESTSLNRIVADKSHRVIVAYDFILHCLYYCLYALKMIIILRRIGYLLT